MNSLEPVPLDTIAERSSAKMEVLIVGGGIGGLEAALSLKQLFKSKARITLIDRMDHQSFLPSIHEAISGKVRPRDIELDLPPLLNAMRVKYIQDEVLALDQKNRKVITNAGQHEYDTLLLACGAEVNFFGVKGVGEFAHLFRSPEQAEKIYHHVKEELANRDKPCKIMVAGGGLEGVEIAGELLDLIHDLELINDLSSARITVEIIEGAPELLPECDLQARNFVKNYLQEKGVKITAATRITEVQRDRVILDSGEEREMTILIWTGGIKPAQWVQESGLPKDSMGWLQVSPWLHLPDNNSLYAIGDIVSIPGTEAGRPLPRVAYHAMDQARVAALNIFYHSHDRRKIRYFPKSKPQLISLGRNMGILSEESLFLSGPWVVRMKKIIEKHHLWTYRSKSYASPFTEQLPGRELRHMARILNPF